MKTSCKNQIDTLQPEINCRSASICERTQVWVDTAQLDGESRLKPRHVLPRAALRAASVAEELAMLRAELTCEPAKSPTRETLTALSANLSHKPEYELLSVAS